MCKKCHFDTLIYKSLPTVGRGHPLSHPPPARSLHSDPCSLATPLFVTMVNKIQIWKFDKIKIESLYFPLCSNPRSRSWTGYWKTSSDLWSSSQRFSRRAERWFPRRRSLISGDDSLLQSIPWCLTRKLYQRSERSDLEIIYLKEGQSNLQQYKEYTLMYSRFPRFLRNSRFFSPVLFWKVSVFLCLQCMSMCRTNIATSYDPALV